MKLADISYKCSQLFDYYSVLPAERLEQDGAYWKSWIAQGHHGQMEYMQRERDDLRVIMPQVRTVVVVALAYPAHCKSQGVARCFSGDGDYHKRVKKRLYELLSHLQTVNPTLNGRAVVDTAPALEKAWAIRGGIGWRGRNSLLITPQGSYFNLGLLLLDVDVQDLTTVVPMKSGCGECRRCVESCPNQAVNSNCTIDARRCISYLNMEAPRLKIDTSKNELHGWIKGCDACQECCPWNNRAQ